MAEQRSTLLICLAPSPRAAAVASEGLRMAAHLDARPLFLHAGADAFGNRDAVLQILRQIAPALPPETLLLKPGKADTVICAAADKLKAAMVVLGALDRDPPGVRAFGSVARLVARNASCSVLLLTEPRAHVLEAGNFVVSLPSDRAAAPMIGMVKRMTARGAVRTVHFVRQVAAAKPPAASGAAGDPETMRLKCEEEARRLTDFANKFDLTGLEVKTAALAGPDGDEVVEYARSQDADLLIMPAPQRRLTMWDRFFQHPAELALRRLPCAVLLFRPPAEA